MLRPMENEYSPYYKTYVNLVPDEPVVKLMERQLDEIVDFFKAIGEDRAAYRYASDKWSIREVLGHIIDTERVFAYRALRFSRNDKTPLPGFDENEYVKHSNFDKQKISDLIKHFCMVRESTVELFRAMDDEITERTGTANNNILSVRAIAYIIVGHTVHHKKIIEERYLVQA